MYWDLVGIGMFFIEYFPAKGSFWRWEFTFPFLFFTILTNNIQIKKSQILPLLRKDHWQFDEIFTDFSFIYGSVKQKGLEYVCTDCRQFSNFGGKSWDTFEVLTEFILLNFKYVRSTYIQKNFRQFDRIFPGFSRQQNETEPANRRSFRNSRRQNRIFSKNWHTNSEVIDKWL